MSKSPLDDFKDEFAKDLFKDEAERKRFDEASNHPYSCRCPACQDWWKQVGLEPDDDRRRRTQQQRGAEQRMARENPDSFFDLKHIRTMDDSKLRANLTKGEHAAWQRADPEQAKRNNIERYESNRVQKQHENKHDNGNEMQ
jgi:hypothetical protein